MYCMSPESTRWLPVAIVAASRSLKPALSASHIVKPKWKSLSKAQQLAAASSRAGSDRNETRFTDPSLDDGNPGGSNFSLSGSQHPRDEHRSAECSVAGVLGYRRCPYVPRR